MTKARLTRGFALQEHFLSHNPGQFDEDIVVFTKGQEVEVIKEIEPDTDGQRLFIIYAPQTKEATVVGAYALEGYDN